MFAPLGARLQTSVFQNNDGFRSRLAAAAAAPAARRKKTCLGFFHTSLKKARTLSAGGKKGRERLRVKSNSIRVNMHNICNTANCYV